MSGPESARWSSSEESRLGTTTRSSIPISPSMLANASKLLSSFVIAPSASCNALISSSALTSESSSGGFSSHRGGCNAAKSNDASEGASRGAVEDNSGALGAATFDVALVSSSVWALHSSEGVFASDRGGCNETKSSDAPGDSRGAAEDKTGALRAAMSDATSVFSCLDVSPAIADVDSDCCRKYGSYGRPSGEVGGAVTEPPLEGTRFWGDTEVLGTSSTSAPVGDVCAVLDNEGATSCLSPDGCKSEGLISSAPFPQASGRAPKVLFPTSSAA
mmetsp:Transcript_97535/g.153659  ORF Transcript_97535/g.153659 Transcript_97535/m.153659 type:complete len:275 (+) Transcript_97535:222-1046(+)